ncbi:hypothetical protein [Roseomonas marmotae]|uniref:EamA family transporter n=1 Tax=Roseomonas marmotae TaxID=2768161 RepID=A0ABS3KG85_9PROT|nr:hypothetical protein [Roseomonas marmotae]MBO1076437.1 hypothetical protein [Roseomonas marmotae]QTI77960.1 hypothetical protein IAI58_09445 [Roseomonas marmotae]
MTQTSPATIGGIAPSFRLGLGSALLAVTMSTNWITSTRFAMRGAEPMHPALLTMIRFGTAALVLAPWRRRLRLIP